MEKDRFSIYFVHSFYLVHLCNLIYTLSYAFFIIFSTSPCVHPVILDKKYIPEGIHFYHNVQTPIVRL